MEASCPAPKKETAMAMVMAIMKEMQTGTRATPLRRARNDKFHGEADNGTPAIADCRL